MFKRLIGSLILAVLLVCIPIMVSAKDHDPKGLHKTTQHPNCRLWVPANPMSAQGLATPYQLIGCNEAAADTAAFVEATIVDPVNGQASVYQPLVITQGTQPAVVPKAPTLPAGAVVGIWTGFNGDTLKLVGPGAVGFVNFAQQAFLNSPPTFAALKAKGPAPPALGTSPVDGQTCPSARDFSIVDQDQSDNTVVSYLFNAQGQSAQNTVANKAALPTAIANGSDEALLNTVDKALGCTPWKAANLTDAGQTVSSGILQEAQAAAHQANPVALVPGLDPFVTTNGKPDLAMQNLYRLQVGQPPTANGNDTQAYCQNMGTVGEQRLKADAGIENGFPGDGVLGNTLANRLANRFVMSWTNLTCDKLVGPSPITVTLDGNGVATGATYA